MKIILLILMLLLMPNPSQAEKLNLFSFDGYEWDRWDSYRKLAFVSGFIAGANYIVGSNIVITHCDERASKVWVDWLASKDKPGKKYTNKEVAMIEQCIKDSNVTNINRYSIAEITSGQIAEALDLFYSDSRNKQIKLSDAIYVVKKQIKGASAKEIESILQWLRGGRKDFDKRFYTDSSGKKTYVTFP